MRHIFIMNPKAGKKDQTGRIYAMAESLREMQAELETRIRRK